MRNLIFATLAALMFVPKASYAQYAQFGMGLYPGMAMCPWGYGGASGAEDDDDDLYAKRKELNNKKNELKKATRAYEAAKKDLQRHDSALSAHLNGSVYAKVKTHIEKENTQAQAISTCVASASSNTPNAGAKAIDAAATLPPACQQGSNLWTAFATDGGVDSDICNQTAPELVKKSSSIENKYRCKDALDKYGAAYSKMKEAAEKKAAAESEVARAKIEYENAKDDAKNRDDDDDDSGTEARTCESGNCPKRSRVKGPSTGQLIAGGVLGVLGGVLSYKGAKYAIDQNSRLGWPSNPYWAAQMGYPLMTAGLYGVLGGGIGAGGFGCGGTMGGAFPMGPMGMMNGMMNPFGGMGNGAFGYPWDMMSPQVGGGMWMPGFGPGNMLNPFGNMGMLNPMMGMMNPMMGMQNPMMNMFNPMMNMMNPMMNPGNLAMQYQQQMMAQYYAQMQQQAQYQQQAMQDYMYRQQTVMTLQTQMQQIQMQIYQISMGGSYGYGNGGLLPYPGTSLGNGTLLPYPSVGFGNNNGLTTCIVAPCPGGLNNGLTPGFTPGTNPYTPRIGR